MDLRGLEPLTPCMPCRCATSCATDPDAVSIARKQPHQNTTFDAHVKTEHLADGARRLLCRLVDRELKGNDRAVFPEPLERVVHAVFFVEHMHDEIAEIEQDPAAL